MEKENYPKVYLYRRIVQAKLFIDNNYANSIDLDNIATEASFSKFHFIRLFKKVYDQTPHQYLTSVRIEKAKLLLQTEMAVADVCFSVGFDSISSFTGLFKKITTSTPSLYQKLQLQRKEEIQKMPLRFIPNCFAETNGWTKDRNFQEVI
jgi:AraC-like DNA-binding protein